MIFEKLGGPQISDRKGRT